MRILRYLHWLIPQALDPSPTRWGDLSIVFLEDDRMAELNAEHLQHEGSTDVITFAFDPVPPEKFHTGELLVNLPLAAAEGEHRGGPSHELALYMTHGINHLAGGVDNTPEGARAMRAAELNWLRAAEEIGYLEELINPYK